MAAGAASALAASAPSGGAPAVCLRLVSKSTLPASAGAAQDVRWVRAPDRVALSLGAGGVVEYVWEAEALESPPLLVAGDNGRRRFHSARLGLSEEYVVSGAPFFVLHWRARTSSLVNTSPAELQLDLVADLDVHGEQVAVLGARRGPEGRFAPGDEVLWTGSLASGLSSLSPRLRASGDAARTMGTCGIFDVGVLRYLPDGTLLVLQGVEAGLVRLAADGQRLQSWDTDIVGIETTCGIAEEERGSFLGSGTIRHLFWINQRRIAEDIVPLPGGFGVLVRRWENGATRWSLVPVIAGMAGVAVDLPVTDPSPFAHLRADARGPNLVLLVFEKRARRSPFPPRLVGVEWRC
ncbi:MAG TPA: hypothetical protein VHQ65_17485 [Thermoanaerobaculia bacterium]|nr:hypothetical protein [Thermoanaerobaculia bacterium]